MVDLEYDEAVYAVKKSNAVVASQDIQVRYNELSPSTLRAPGGPTEISHRQKRKRTRHTWNRWVLERALRTSVSIVVFGNMCLIWDALASIRSSFLYSVNLETPMAQGQQYTPVTGFLGQIIVVTPEGNANVAPRWMGTDR
jgi:hypothetical protein